MLIDFELAQRLLEEAKNRPHVTTIILDAQNIEQLDGLNRTTLTREQNVMEFIKCFLPKARVEIERLRVEEL